MFTVVAPKLFGLKGYGVLTGSMEPEYPVGSLIYVKSVNTDELNIGNDITFVLDETLTTVTHRIVDISDNGEFFTTQGIANSVKDREPVYYKNIIGVPKITIPYLGYAVQFFNTTYGRIAGIGLILLLMVFSLIPNKKILISKPKIRKEEFKGETQPM